MQTVKNIIVTLGSVSALDRKFAMSDAMCPSADQQRFAAYFEVNQFGYDEDSIEGQLQSNDPKDYDLNCMRFCLSKLDHAKRNNCCGSYPQDDGRFSCWLINDETSGISFNRGAHRAIMIGEEDWQRTLYNLTMTGLIDLGFNEISGAAVNDTVTSVDIAVYPDGVTKTQIHLDTNENSTIAPKNYIAIGESFFVMPQNDSFYAEMNLIGSFASEAAGATNATFNTTNIDSMGAGFQMLGFGGANPNDQSDVMLLYEVKPLENVEPIFRDPEFGTLLMEHCSVWIFNTGFFCSM